MIYTFGYSRWTVEQVRAKMDELGVDLLVDVRSVPFGRFNPAFNKPNLLRHFGERYRWKGPTLGGKSGPVTDEGMKWLVGEHGRGRTLLLMCVEMDPRNCHRLLDIGARLFVESGINAVHLFHDGSTRTTREYMGNIGG